MADDAANFFDFIVEPALEEYEAAEAALTNTLADQTGNSADARLLVLRRARTASIELHQFTDRAIANAPAWLKASTAAEIREWLTRDHVRRVNGSPVDDISILHDVADAFKHAKLKRKSAWHLKSDRVIVSITTGYGQLGYSEGKNGGVEQLTVKLLDGRLRALSLVLLTARDAWASAMGKDRKLIGWEKP